MRSVPYNPPVFLLRPLNEAPCIHSGMYRPTAAAVFSTRSAPIYPKSNSDN